MKHITPKSKKITELYRTEFNGQSLSFFLNKDVCEYLRSPLLSNVLNINNILLNTTLFTLNSSPVFLSKLKNDDDDDDNNNNKWTSCPQV